MWIAAAGRDSAAPARAARRKAIAERYSIRDGLAMVLVWYGSPRARLATVCRGD